MSACWYTFLNWHCLLEPPAMALGSIPMPWGGGLAVSTVGLSSARRSRTPLACCSGTPFAYYVGTPIACCSGTPSPPFNCSSKRVLRGGALVLGGGATGTSSSSDHSNTAVLCVRVVRSPSSEMPPGLRGAAPTVFLFFWVSSSTAALFPRTFSDTGDGLSDEMLTSPSLGCVGGRASTACGQSSLGSPKKYTALSCEWILA